MPTSVIYNDFRYGQLSKYVRRRADLSITQQGALLLENATPLTTGGITLRPGMVRLASADGIERILPFVISVTEHYILAFAIGRLYIYQEDLSTGEYENISGDGFILPYKSKDDIRRIRPATTNNIVVLANRDYPPYVIQKGLSGGFSVSVITLDTSTDRVDTVTDDEGKETEVPYQWDYQGLFTKNNYPATAAFIANRLWFAGSKEYPYRFWASRPFNYWNFQTEDYYETIDESVKPEEYLDAIQKYPSSVTDNEDGTETRVTSTVSDQGYVVITTAKYDTETDELIGTVETEYVYYTRPTVTWNTIEREDCALMLDVATDRDEHIEWISAAGEYIYLGSASSEHALPYAINALTMARSKVGSFGSADSLTCTNGQRNIFYVQSGKRKLRTIGPDLMGDLTTYSPEILSKGVVELHWQRVDQPRLHCVLSDGTIAVLCYDLENQIQGWCSWKSELNVKSLSVVDVEDGQRVLALVEDNNGNRFLEKFQDGVYTDDGTAKFHATLDTCFIDSAATMNATKKNYGAYVDSLNTRFKVGVSGKKLSTPISFDKSLIDIYPYSKPGNDGLSFRIESFEGEPFTLLVLVVSLEVN